MGPKLHSAASALFFVRNAGAATVAVACGLFSMLFWAGVIGCGCVREDKRAAGFGP
jgi:hypothetical protein